MVEAERDGVRGGGGLGLIGIGIGLDDDVGDSDIDLLRSSPPAPALESLVSVVVVHIPAGNDNGESDAEVIVITDTLDTQPMRIGGGMVNRLMSHVHGPR